MSSTVMKDIQRAIRERTVEMGSGKSTQSSPLNSQ